MPKITIRTTVYSEPGDEGSDFKEISSTTDYSDSDDLAFHAENLGDWVEPWGTSGDGTWEPASLVDTAVRILTGYAHQFYAAEASASPTDRVGVWYSADTYKHPYRAQREERTAHLEGFTAEQQREIYAGVFPGKAA